MERVEEKKDEWLGKFEEKLVFRYISWPGGLEIQSQRWIHSIF
jgi:hypothetical protein